MLKAKNNPDDINNFSIPLDVELFDRVVSSFYSGQSDKNIHDVLARFQLNANSWKRSKDILDKSQKQESKILALNILKRTIEVQWPILPPKQKTGMRVKSRNADEDFLDKFVEELILKVANDPNFSKLSSYVSKLNLVLIEIIKREWPHNMPNFISQVVEVSRKSEAVCINNIKLLRMLGEEAASNFSDLTHSQQMKLRDNLNKEFNKVFQLCMYILRQSKNQKLIHETLQTLSIFLKEKWIPNKIIFESSLIEALAIKYYSIGPFRSDCLECVIEIVSIKTQEINECSANPNTINEKLLNLYMKILQTSTKQYNINKTTNFEQLVKSSDSNRSYIQHFCNFLASMFNNHKNLLEKTSDNTRQAYSIGLQLLFCLTDCNNETIFQISLDFWDKLSRYLDRSLPNPKKQLNFDIDSNNNNNKEGEKLRTTNPLYQLYKPILHNLKFVLMNRLPCPKEVLVVEDEYGNAVRTTSRDTLQLDTHIKMSKTLHTLSRIDPEDTRVVIGKKLEDFKKNIYNPDFKTLQSLCWSIGSVAGSMSSDKEKSFLVVVIKILLQLCEKQRTKDNKAIIAACIMYVVRKYPRFLLKHWRFLQTVVRKLIEFLHEKHPGVQDMSIETLEEISLKCGHQFLSIQKDDNEAFWFELMDTLNSKNMVSDLNNEQIENLFHCWAVVINKESNINKSKLLVRDLLKQPSKQWTNMVENGKHFKNNNTNNNNSNNNNDYFEEKSTIMRIKHLLNIFKKTCQGLENGSFLIPMTHIFLPMMEFYSVYARKVSRSLSSDINSNSSPKIKAMKSLKSSCLLLFETFIKTSNKKDEEQIVKQFLPNFLKYVITDYQNSVAQAREAACIAACCAVIEKFGKLDIKKQVQQIFTVVFKITFNMLEKSKQTYPDHRKNFFRLLYGITKNCFNIYKSMNQQQLKHVIGCIMWGIAHIDGNISETSIKTFEEFLKHLRNDRNLCTTFYSRYIYPTIEQILSISTDNLHKQQFALLCELLRQICLDIQSSNICGNIFDNNNSNNNYSNNTQYVGNIVSKILNKKFKNLTNKVINHFISECFRISIETKNNKINNLNQNHPFLLVGKDLLVNIRIVHHISSNNTSNNRISYSNNNNNNYYNNNTQLNDLL